MKRLLVLLALVLLLATGCSAHVIDSTRAIEVSFVTVEYPDDPDRLIDASRSVGWATVSDKYGYWGIAPDLMRLHVNTAYIITLTRYQGGNPLRIITSARLAEEE